MEHCYIFPFLLITKINLGNHTHPRVNDLSYSMCTTLLSLLMLESFHNSEFQTDLSCCENSIREICLARTAPAPTPPRSAKQFQLHQN